MDYEKMMEKAKEAKSAEELLALAKENDIGMTEEEAEETFAMLGKSGELSDEELANVSGGSCHVNVGGKNYTVVTSHLRCMNGYYQNNFEYVGETLEGQKMYNLLYAKDNSRLRLTWMTFSVEGQCGMCRWLSFKAGTGYCSKSAE